MPIAATTASPTEDRDPAREVVRGAGQLELGRGHGGDAAQVADREVDLPEEEDEDDAEGDHRHPGHLQDDVDEVRGGEEVRRRQTEEEDDRELAEDDREDAEVARLEVVAGGLPHPPGTLGSAAVGERDARCHDVRLGAHWATSAPVAAMPATFVGMPAVIAWTTSCCVVLSRS